MSKPAAFDLDITQGEDFSLELEFSQGGSPVDITGWVFSGQIRETAESETKLADFVFEATDAAAGKVRVSLADMATADLPAGRLAYDWWVNYGADIDMPVFGGCAKIWARVTR